MTVSMLDKSQSSEGTPGFGGRGDFVEIPLKTFEAELEQK